MKEIKDKIPLSQKWYDGIEVATDCRTGKTSVKAYRKTPKEIGESLEDLVEVALRQLGCEVMPPETFVKDKSGLPWVYDKKRKEWVLKFRTIGGLPSFKEEGKFKTRGIVFKRLPNVKDKPDFVTKNIAIEVKNRDPSYPYREYHKFEEEILDRFKKVRKKRRYLLIPKGVLNNRQRKMLKRRKIKEVYVFSSSGLRHRSTKN